MSTPAEAVPSQTTAPGIVQHAELDPGIAAQRSAQPGIEPRIDLDSDKQHLPGMGYCKRWATLEELVGIASADNEPEGPLSHARPRDLSPLGVRLRV